MSYTHSVTGKGAGKIAAQKRGEKERENTAEKRE